MSDKKSRTDAMDELTLVLLYLTRFSNHIGSRFHELAWKNYDNDTINRLDSGEYIFAPQGRRRVPYAYLTEKGRRRAQELLAQMGIADQELYEHFAFRAIRRDEAEEAAQIEQVCFPPHEACSKKHMVERVYAAPEFFLVAIDKASGQMAGFLNGIATNEEKFRDAFFTDAALHDPAGRTVMLLGLDVLPQYRKQGLARELVFQYCRNEQEKGRQRLVLTCLANKVKMYQKLGFLDLGESDSTWGGERWHEMFVPLNN